MANFTVPEESDDESLDLFNLPEAEGAPPMLACGRSQSAPASFWFEEDAAAERRMHITTIVDVVNGAGAPTAYRAEITSVEEEDLLLRMADGSEFALPAAPSMQDSEEGVLADISFAPPLTSPVPADDDSSWILQPILSRAAQEESYVSDGAVEARFRSRYFNMFSTDPSPVASPVSQGFREYSASDPGAPSQDVGGSRTVSELGEDFESAADVHHESFEASSSSAAPVDVSSQDGVISTSHPTAPAPATAPATADSESHFSQVANLPITSAEQRAPTSITTSITLGRSSSISPHIFNISSSGKYSDTRIQLASASDAFPSSTFDVHRVIISQSSVLNTILERETKPNPTIDIIARKSFSAVRGFELALQHLYGLELLDQKNVYHFAHEVLGLDAGGDCAPDKLKKAAMDLALCYGSAGAFLNQADVVEAAFNLVMDLLDWGNLETALQFGLFPEDFLLAYIPNAVTSNNKSSSNDTNSNNNKDSKGNRKKRRARRGKKSIRKALEKAVVLDNLNTDVVLKWAPNVASAAINFFVQNLPSSYHFDRTTSSKDLQDRIPVHLRSVYSIAHHNPLLVTLTFGEHPTPTPECTRASAILLALPFVRFREVVERMRNRGILTGDMIKAILQEREERRLHALQEYARRTSDEEGDVDTLRELGYREFAIHVQTLDYDPDSNVDVIRHEYSLHREWRGLWDEGDGIWSVIRNFGDDHQ